MLRSFASVVSVLRMIDVRKTHPASLKHQHGEITSPYFHRSDYTVLCLTAQKCMGFSETGFPIPSTGSSPFYLFQTARKYPIFQIDPHVISLPRYIPFYPVISPSPFLSPRQQECQGCEATNGNPERGGVFDGIFGPRMAFCFFLWP